MNPDRDALEGLVNSNDVGSAEGLPSVSPYLVEHLKARFTAGPVDDPNPHTALYQNYLNVGQQSVLTYLEQLAQNKGVNANEPTQTKSASTDTRRPSTSRRS